MNQSWLRISAFLAAVALAACSQNGMTSSLPPTSGAVPAVPAASAQHVAAPMPLQRAPFAPVGTYRQVCAGASRLPGHDHCEMLMRTDAGARLAIAPAALSAGEHPSAVSCEMQPGCYGPAALQSAYNVTALAKTRGKGVTVALVDAYGYPGVQADLNEYRAAFGLPPCKAGCFKVVNQNGKTSPLPKPNSNPNDDWRGEQALDIDMVSALCPNCHILLVQTVNDFSNNLAAGAVTAANLGAAVVSNSYAGNEYAASDPSYARTGVVYTASAGDSGAGPGQPCSLPSVVCVGGTSLRPATNARRWNEVVWDGLTVNECGTAGNSPCATGSGCSTIVPKPGWQHDKGCTMRSESDISADADPYTGVAIACKPCGGDATHLLEGDGGTSASSPMIAALIALAGNARTVAQPQGIWKHGGSKGFNDVTVGTNESKAAGTFICPQSYVYICKARKGYDGPTGWGTPNGLSAL